VGFQLVTLNNKGYLTRLEIRQVASLYLSHYIPAFTEVTGLQQNAYLTRSFFWTRTRVPWPRTLFLFCYFGMSFFFIDRIIGCWYNTWVSSMPANKLTHTYACWLQSGGDWLCKSSSLLLHVYASYRCSRDIRRRAKLYGQTWNMSWPVASQRPRHSQHSSRHAIAAQSPHRWILSHRYLMITLLQISWRMRQWKNFENRPVFDEVVWTTVAYFLWPTLCTVCLTMGGQLGQACRQSRACFVSLYITKTKRHFNGRNIKLLAVCLQWRRK